MERWWWWSWRKISNDFWLRAHAAWGWQSNSAVDNGLSKCMDISWNQLTNNIRTMFIFIISMANMFDVLCLIRFQLVSLRLFEHREWVIMNVCRCCLAVLSKIHPRRGNTNPWTCHPMAHPPQIWYTLSKTQITYTVPLESVCGLWPTGSAYLPRNILWRIQIMTFFLLRKFVVILASSHTLPSSDYSHSELIVFWELQCRGSNQIEMQN